MSLLLAWVVGRGRALVWCCWVIAGYGNMRALPWLLFLLLFLLLSGRRLPRCTLRARVAIRKNCALRLILLQAKKTAGASAHLRRRLLRRRCCLRLLLPKAPREHLRVHWHEGAQHALGRQRGRVVAHSLGRAEGVVLRRGAAPAERTGSWRGSNATRSGGRAGGRAGGQAR